MSRELRAESQRARTSEGLDRRSFLTGTAGAGAALALAGVVGTSCAPSPEPGPVATGYAVGQRAPGIVGADQFNHTTTLADFAGKWVMIDLCPLWCDLCIRAAVNHRAFRDYINHQGIGFELLSVVVDTTTPGQSAGRLEAERWAYRFGLQPFPVLHCSGDATSPLRDLVTEFAAANGNSEPGYPTYVLVDPTGVIRLYQGGNDLNVVQAKIAEATGTPLAATWTPGPSRMFFPVGDPLQITEATITGAFTGQPPFHTVVPDPNSAPTPVSFGRFDGVVPGLDLNMSVLVTDPDTDPSQIPTLDPETDFTLSFRNNDPAIGRYYSRWIGIDGSVGLLDSGAFSDAGPDLSHLVTGTATLTELGDGVEVSVPAIAELLAGEPVGGRSWYSIWFKGTDGGGRWATAYSGVESLIPIVSQSGLDPRPAAAVTAHLRAALRSLTDRDFDTAASATAAAAAAVPAPGTNLGAWALRSDCEWLAGHLADIAAAA